MSESTGSETVMISLRLDKRVKKDAEALFSELGINMTSAISMFLRRCLMENKIPFEIGLCGGNAGSVKETKTDRRTKIECGEMTFDELCGLVAPIAREHGVKRMYLFGSRARGDNREDSDFDFCVDVPKSFDLMDLGGLMGDLEDAIGTKVDLLCEDDMHEKPHLMEEVLRDRKLVYG